MHPFGLTCGGRSRRREHPSEETIRLIRRELIQKRKKGSGAWHFLVALLQLALLTLGLCQSIVGGLSLKAEPLLLYGGLLLMCVFFTAFFYEDWITGARAAGAAAIVLVTSAAVLFLQQAFLSGFSQLGCAVLERMNSCYHGDYMIPVVPASETNLSLFLLLVFVPITAFLGGFVVYSPDVLLVWILVFPLMALLLLAGATPSLLAMGSIVTGTVSILASARVGNFRRLWGSPDDPRFQQNQRTQRSIRAVSGLLACLIAAVVMFFSYFLFLPSVSIALDQTESFSEEIKGRFTQKILKMLPDMRGGRFSSPTDVSAGGVSDGSLMGGSGYLIDDIEDLLLYCTEKPQETIYLRGFVGASYEKNQWKEPKSENFAAASDNWETSGNPEIYLFNLPFLRMLYKEREAGEQSAPAELTVERINASDRYTYIPYGCYLNDYYVIDGGDGGVEGQTAQDDIIPFYFRAEQMGALTQEYFLQKESALDRLERSYAVYAQEHYTEVPEGFENLKDQCQESGVTGEDLNEVTAYIQSFLMENYTYSVNLPAIPEGKDAVQYFLYESKVGCSPQYASAATIMFRIFGVPARYVVGYAASKSLFSQQEDGAYQAVLQSDNAHAWVEIYMSGTGWMPVETTPGELGMVQDVEFYGTQPTDAPQDTILPQETDTAENAGVSEQPARGAAFIIWTVLTFAAAVTILCALWWRKRLRDLGFAPGKPALYRVRCIFAGYYRALVKAGMPSGVESTSVEFAQWVEKLDPEMDKKRFEAMMERVLESCFGGRESTEEDVIWMRKTCCKAERRIRRLPRRQGRG